MSFIVKIDYDLILLDLQMPGMDGFQVMDSLQKIEPDDYLPILVITAQPGHKLRALQAGAKDFISKPFELAEVLARVHNILGSMPAAEEIAKLQYGFGTISTGTDLGIKGKLPGDHFYHDAGSRIQR